MGTPQFILPSQVTPGCGKLTELTGSRALRMLIIKRIWYKLKARKWLSFNQEAILCQTCFLYVKNKYYVTHLIPYIFVMVTQAKTEIYEPKSIASLHCLYFATTQKASRTHHMTWRQLLEITFLTFQQQESSSTA